MLRLSRAVLARAAAVATGTASISLCHGRHSSEEGRDDVDAKIEALTERLSMLEAATAKRYGVSQTTGQNGAVFSWDERLTAKFPAECAKHEANLHGGFNEDPATGMVYTGVPGVGLYAISADLETWTRIGNDQRLMDNIHGLTVFEHGGRTLVAVAQNKAQRVLIVDAADGAVLHELRAPRGGEFDCDAANAYYSARAGGESAAAAFACTDVTYLDGKLYVATGYCEGDFVLCASPQADGSGGWSWGKTAWGGKGDGPGQFRTAHGITAHAGHIYVSNREAHEVVKFTPDGKVVGVMPDIPAGSRICNVAKARGDDAEAAASRNDPGAGHFYMNALAPLSDGTTYVDRDGQQLVRGAARTAPIYAHTGEQLVSVIDAGALGIPVLKHVHHVWPHYVPADGDGEARLHLLVHGWRNGKFAVLRHEPQA